MQELLNQRRENSKTFLLDNGKRQWHGSGGAIHYKDNYADNAEAWKDIDLTWDGNRITKAPYELTLDGNKLTLRDKKTGEISTIELLGIGGKNIPAKAWEKSRGLAKAPGIVNLDNVALDTDLEIVVSNSGVKFTRVLKSDKAPATAQFRVTGKLPFLVKAKDTDVSLRPLPVEWSLKDGVLTETLTPDRVVKYPVRIDPTWQVGASTDDCRRRLATSGWDITAEPIGAGKYDETYYQYGSGMRFLGVTPPQGTTITSAYLTICAYESNSGLVCNTRISAEDVDDAATFANDAAAFDARFATHTTARVDWDGIPAWTAETEYSSPEIKTVIQEIIDRALWVSGNDIVIFWEDFDDRSTITTGADQRRSGYTYDLSAAKAPKLVITFSMGYSESTTTNLSLATSINRDFAANRTTAIALSLAVSIARTLAANRATATALSLATTVTRVYGRVRTTATALGLTPTVSRVVSISRTIATALSLTPTVSRVATFARSVATGLSLTTSVARSHARTITTAVALSLTTTVTKSLGVAISVATALSLTPTVTRIRGYNKTISTAISFATSISSYLNLNKIYNYSRGWLLNQLEGKLSSSHEDKLTTSYEDKVIEKEWGR